MYFELCIRAGQQVLDAMMEQDRTALCGPRWKRDPDRQAGRAGTTPSEVTLSDSADAPSRPQSVGAGGRASFAFASHRDPLDAHAVNAVACGIAEVCSDLDTLPEEVAERSTRRGLGVATRHDDDAADPLAATRAIASRSC